MATTKIDLIFKVLVTTDEYRKFKKTPLLSEAERFDYFDRLCVFTKQELVDLVKALCALHASDVKVANMLQAHFSS